MTKQEFDMLFNKKLEELRDIRDRKHDEYADDYETFRNLKDGAAKLGINPKYYAFILMTKQYNSLNDLVLGRPKDVKLVWEKVQDIIIYSMLIYGLFEEEK